jgi:hypothetical protein
VGLSAFVARVELNAFVAEVDLSASVVSAAATGAEAGAMHPDRFTETLTFLVGGGVVSGTSNSLSLSSMITLSADEDEAQHDRPSKI